MLTNYIPPRLAHLIGFSVEGPGEIVATDNGDPTDLDPFPSMERKAFDGLALVIIRSWAGGQGMITVTATSAGLKEVSAEIDSRSP